MITIIYGSDCVCLNKNEYIFIDNFVKNDGSNGGQLKQSPSGLPGVVTRNAKIFQIIHTSTNNTINNTTDFLVGLSHFIALSY